MKDLLAFGVKTVPVVARGGEFVFAQALEDVSRFVGTKFDSKRLPPEELIDKWLAVLRAAQRHAQQIPAGAHGRARGRRAATAASATSPTTCTRSPTRSCRRSRTACRT